MGEGWGEVMLCTCGIFAIFDRPEMKYVRAQMYLAGHFDRSMPKNYFEPCWLYHIIFIFCRKCSALMSVLMAAESV